MDSWEGKGSYRGSHRVLVALLLSTGTGEERLGHLLEVTSSSGVEGYPRSPNVPILLRIPLHSQAEHRDLSECCREETAQPGRQLSMELSTQDVLKPAWQEEGVQAQLLLLP